MGGCFSAASVAELRSTDGNGMPGLASHDGVGGGTTGGILMRNPEEEGVGDWQSPLQGEIETDARSFSHNNEVIPGVSTVRSILNLPSSMGQTANFSHLHGASATSHSSRADFLAFVAHELRNPLHNVIGVTEILLSTHLSGEQRELVESLALSSNLMRKIVDDVLDLGKIKSGHMEMEKVSFDLLALLRDIERMNRAHAPMTGVEWQVVIHDSLLPAISAPAGIPARRMVIGDATRLLQVLTNLLSNAFKFTQSGFVRLSARVIPGDELSAEHYPPPPLNLASRRASRVGDDGSPPNVSVTHGGRASLEGKPTWNVNAIGGSNNPSGFHFVEAQSPRSQVNTATVVDQVSHRMASPSLQPAPPPSKTPLPFSLQASTQKRKLQRTSSESEQEMDSLGAKNDSMAGSGSKPSTPQVQSPMVQGMSPLLSYQQPHDPSVPLLFEFQISDSGIGISGEALPKLFEDYTQAKVSIAREFGGTGLGLSIVRSLVELMAGSLRVSSELGKGTTFTVCLPMCEDTTGFMFEPGTPRCRSQASMLLDGMQGTNNSGTGAERDETPSPHALMNKTSTFSHRAKRITADPSLAGTRSISQTGVNVSGHAFNTLQYLNYPRKAEAVLGIRSSGRNTPTRKFETVESIGSSTTVTGSTGPSSNRSSGSSLSSPIGETAATTRTSSALGVVSHRSPDLADSLSPSNSNSSVTATQISPPAITVQIPVSPSAAITTSSSNSTRNSTNPFPSLQEEDPSVPMSPVELNGRHTAQIHVPPIAFEPAPQQDSTNSTNSNTANRIAPPSTTISITAPNNTDAKAASSPDGSPKKTTRTSKANAWSKIPGAESLRILLVEDNLPNQKLGKMMLSKRGFQVLVASDGVEAVALVNADGATQRKAGKEPPSSIKADMAGMGNLESPHSVSDSTAMSVASITIHSGTSSTLSNVLHSAITSSPSTNVDAIDSRGNGGGDSPTSNSKLSPGHAGGQLPPRPPSLEMQPSTTQYDAAYCSIDLILMDLNMPRMNGLTATQQLRSSGFTGRILALTANASASQRLLCLEAGMDGFLLKPFKPDELAIVVMEQSKLRHHDPPMSINPKMSMCAVEADEGLAHVTRANVTPIADPAAHNSAKAKGKHTIILRSKPPATQTS